MPEKRGTIFGVSRGCFHDGPGLRTVVFLKGCRLGCPWCHNVEGIAFEPQLLFDATRCIECGTCRDGNGDDCPTGARRRVGDVLTAPELVEHALIDRAFMSGTGGGVTFSGGEPLCQPEFLFACCDELRARGVHVAVETAGYWSRDLVVELLQRVDLVIFDLKHVDPEVVSAQMGRDADVILRNLEDLLESDVDLELRLTIVPGFNESPHDRAAIESWLAGKPRRLRPEILRFHAMGEAKRTLVNTARSVCRTMT